MKKYILFLFIFGLFIFNINSANALVAGCTSTSGYSSVNGESCNPVPGCTSTSGFSSVNGESCDNKLVSTVDLKVNGNDSNTLKYGESLNLSWTSSNTSSCQGYVYNTISSWNGAKSLSGSESIQNLPVGKYNFIITCMSPTVKEGVSTKDEAEVEVIYSVSASILPSGCSSTSGFSSTTGNACNGTTVATQSTVTPSVYLKANGIKDEGGDKLLKVKYGEAVNLSWESNGEYCEGYDYVASSSWNGKKVSSGSEVISNLALGKHTLVIYCYSSKYGKSSDAPNYAKDDHLTVEVVSTSTSVPSLDSSITNTSSSATLGTGSSVTPSSTCIITRTLRLGSRGADVSCLQSRLGLVSDGKFGPRTLIIVKAFQANAGLKADGVVGPRSVKALEVAN